MDPKAEELQTFSRLLVTQIYIYIILIVFTYIYSIYINSFVLLLKILDISLLGPFTALPVQLLSVLVVKTITKGTFRILTLTSLTLLYLQTLTLFLGVVRSKQNAMLRIFVFTFLFIGKAGLNDSGKRPSRKENAAIFLTSFFIVLLIFTDMLVSRFARNDPSLFLHFILGVILTLSSITKRETVKRLLIS